MALKSWKTLKSEIFKKTPWTTFVQNEFEMPNGKKGTYYFVKTNGSAMVIPITSEGKIVLTRQYRYLVDEESLEFPAGGVKEGQNSEQAAHAELEEETGYRAEDLQYIGEFVPMNGVTDEKCRVFIARNMREGTARPEETEEGMEQILFSFQEIEEMIKKNIIKDGMTLAAWALAKHHI
ncbi:MAG: NUDIX hydrolase [Patescibacteria group bacterium]